MVLKNTHIEELTCVAVIFTKYSPALRETAKTTRLYDFCKYTWKPTDS